jgi:hypothetical protein
MDSLSASIKSKRRCIMAKEGKVRLPKPVSTAQDSDYEAYLAQFDPAGDRRLLSQEILRLRSIIRGLGGDPVEKAVAAPVRTRVRAQDEIDNALI